MIEHLCKPIQTHILNAPISIYIDNKYIPNKYVPAIRSHCSSYNAKSYLMQKRGWKTTTINDIEWEKVKKIIEKLSIAKRKTAIKFSHRWLSSGSKNFAESLICSHCKQKDFPETDHNHFLTCEFSSPYQTKRINKLSVLLVSMKTPNEVLSLLTKGLSFFITTPVTKTYLLLFPNF